MKNIIINDEHLQSSNVNKFGSKSRAVLIQDNKILLSNYGGVFLLPGGSIEKNETPDDAIIRELSEEIGINYNINELKPFLTLKYYQPNYPTRYNDVINRMITTYYYLGQYKGINADKFHRTDGEIKDNFYLQLIEIEELSQLLNQQSDNPRKEYFDREINEVIKALSFHK